MKRIAAKTRVANGLALLLKRKVSKTRLRKVMTGDFKLKDGGYCVLGKLYGGFSKGWSTLGLSDMEAFLHGFIGTNIYGFDVPQTGNYDTDCRLLEREWKKQIGAL